MNGRYRAIAEYYDAEYAHQRMLQEDVPFFLAQLPRRPRKILELGVGTARAAIPLAQAGHRVTGIDSAADMVAIARRKRDAVGLGDRQLLLECGDVLRLSLGRTFDWICIFFNTFLAFTTLAEQDQLLQRVREHLRPGGRFWIDIFNPDFQMLARPRQEGLEPRLFHVPRFDRTVMTTTDIRRDVTAQVQEVTFRYAWIDKSGRERRERLTFRMTWIMPRELQLLAERNGLRIERWFGNYDGSALTSASPRIIAVCKPA